MNKIAFFLGLFMAFQTNAQEVNYKVKADDPNSYPWLSINSDIIQFEMIQNSIDAWSFNVGLWGYVEPINKLGVSYNFRKSWLALGRLSNTDYPGNTDIQVGGYLYLFSRNKTTTVKVTLDRVQTGSTYNSNGRVDHYTETYLMLPATRKKKTAIQAGLYRKVTPFDFEEITDEDFTFPHKGGRHAASGFYAGLLSRRITNLVIDTEEYGTCANSIGTDIYLDVLFLPGQNFTELNSGDNINDPIKTDKGLGKDSPIGFRVGWRMFQVAQKATTGKKFGMSSTFEVGTRPYDGFFINIGLGMTFVKAVK